MGLLLTVAIYWIFRARRPGHVRGLFGRLQILSAAFMAFSHGSNDGQKFIGTFALALVLGGVLPEFGVPLWVILLCAGTMGVGTAVGGWRIVKTMGLRLTKLDPVHGFVRCHHRCCLPRLCVTHENASRSPAARRLAAGRVHRHPSISGASGMNFTVAMILSTCSAPNPACALPAPAKPPIRACDELVGSPHHHVKRSQTMAPTRPARTT